MKVLKHLQNMGDNTITHRTVPCAIISETSDFIISKYLENKTDENINISELIYETALFEICDGRNID